MPSLYDQDAGNGVPFGDNARRVKPTSRLGTRQIQRWIIYTIADIETDYLAPNSLYSQLVRAIQQNVELYGVYMPGSAFFNSNELNYAFMIDAAVDTSVDLWTATNSTFGSELHPMEWNFADESFNNNTQILIDTVYQTLINAGAESSVCWVSPTYASGDLTWPIGAPGSSPPGAAEGVGTFAKTDPTLVPQPGDTPEVLNQKKLKLLAKLRS